MKAAACTGYGSPAVLRVEDVPAPVPQHNEVRVKVRASSVTAADTMMRRGTPAYARLFLGVTRPKHRIPGTGFAGVVDAIGPDVQQYEQADAVFGETGARFGANAEYVCVPEDGVLAAMPSSTSFEEAAPICDGALTALHFLRDLGGLRSGQRVLVNGATGSLGAAAIQIARNADAQVTAVCSTRGIDLAKSLGAAHVVDYATTDFTSARDVYDIIFDAVGKSSFARCRSALRDEGAYLSPVLSLRLLFEMLWTKRIGNRRARFSATGLRPAAELRPMLGELKAMLEAGRLRSVIDRRYSLGQIAEAHRYVDTGRKQGNVVIVMDDQVG